MRRRVTVGGVAAFFGGGGSSSRRFRAVGSVAGASPVLRAWSLAAARGIFRPWTGPPLSLSAGDEPGGVEVAGGMQQQDAPCRDKAHEREPQGVVAQLAHGDVVETEVDDECEKGGVAKRFGLGRTEQDAVDQEGEASHEGNGDHPADVAPGGIEDLPGGGEEGEDAAPAGQVEGHVGHGDSQAPPEEFDDGLPQGRTVAFRPRRRIRRTCRRRG